MANYPRNYYQSGLQTGLRSGVAATTGMVSRSALNMGGMGALVGGAAAAAQAIPKVRNNQMTAGQATRGVIKEAAGTGVATAAGAAVAGAVGLGGMVSLLAMFGVATGVKYMWNSVMEGQPGETAPAVATEQAAPAPAKAKRATKK